MTDNKISNITELGLKKNSFISLLSSRRSGKSYMVSNLAHYFLTNEENKIDYIYMFSHTGAFDDNYEWIDKSVVFPASVQAMNTGVANILDIQKRTGRKSHVLIIFDDIDLDKEVSGINKLAVAGRHYKVTTILSAQVTNHAVSNAIKNNTTYLFWRKLSSKAIKDQIYSIVNSFEYPRHLYDHTMNNNHNYVFLFYDNDSDDEAVKLVKAQPKEFKYVHPVEKVKTPQQRKKHSYDPFPIGNYDPKRKSWF